MRSARALLRVQQVDDLRARTRVVLCARDRIVPRRGIGWIAGEEVGDARVIEHVVGGQPANPGESTDVNRKPGTWSRVCLRTRVLWCLVGETGMGLQRSYCCRA